MFFLLPFNWYPGEYAKIEIGMARGLVWTWRCPALSLGAEGMSCCRCWMTKGYDHFEYLWMIIIIFKSGWLQLFVIFQPRMTKTETCQVEPGMNCLLSQLQLQNTWGTRIRAHNPMSNFDLEPLSRILQHLGVTLEPPKRFRRMIP